MIRINLAPPAALIDKIWFVPELLFFLIIAGSIWTGVQFFLKGIADDTLRVRSEIEAINKDTENLNPDIARFEQVTKQIETLKDKLRSIESLTVSKVGRYLPIIVLEYIQKMKPQGLWIKTLRQNSTDQQISLTGGSFDNLLIAEFINSINETRKQEVNPQDVRSYVYFSSVLLENISSDASQQTDSGGSTSANAAGPKTEMQRAFEDTEEIKPAAKSSSVTENKIFPELNNFPTFSMTLKYAERGTEDLRQPSKLRKP